MKSLKKVATLTLFLALIISFVLYKADIFTFEKTKTSSKIIVSNVKSTKDTLNKDKRLIVDYVLGLAIDTTYLTVEKIIIKTFTLETLDTQLISGSKSIQVSENWEIPNYASKNDSVMKKLEEYRVKRVRFIMNRAFDGNANDSDLLQVIQFVENKTLKSNSSIEFHTKEQDIVDLYWKKFNKGQVEIHKLNTLRKVLVNRKKVDKFLKWYQEFKLKQEARREKEFIIMLSSKSGPVTDLNEIRKPSPEYLEEKKLFEEKVKAYLEL